MRTVNSEMVFKTPFFQVIKDIVDIQSRQITYWKVSTPEVVIILSFFKGKIVMVDHHRFTLGHKSLELPAGTVEKNETPVECAKRELSEETGFVAGNMKKIFSFYPSNGVSDQLFHVCVASGLVPGSHHREHDELMEVVLMKESVIVDKILDGSVSDGRTIAAVLVNGLRKK